MTSPTPSQGPGPEGTPTDPGGALAPFRVPRYAAYWLTSQMANFGWMIQTVGASWLMTSLGGTPDLVALVQTAIAVPLMLFSLPAGAIADAVGRRATVLVSQSFLLVVSVALAVSAWGGWLTPWSLLVFTFLIGCGRALHSPGWQTMVTEIVPRPQLPAAIALGSAGFNLARSVGPAIGGAVVATIGAFGAFVVHAVANLGVILVALRWKAAPRADTLPPEPMLGAIIAGVRYVALSPNLVAIVLRSGVLNLMAVAFMGLMPLVARDLLGGGPTLYGLLLGAFGVGALLGALASALVRRLWSLEQRVQISFGAYAAALVVIASSTSAALTLAASALAGMGWLVAMSTFNTNVQLSAPRWVLARAHASYQTVNFGCAAIGGLLWGAVAGRTDLGVALYLAAAGLVAGMALALVSPLRELDGRKLDPDAPWSEPRIAVDMLPRSGPILTSVEYRIAESDAPQFLALMVERRRIRIRDGGFRWTVSRDIVDPEIWIERWKTPTWTEVRRAHLRRTVDAAELADRLRALHRGPERPRVRYELVRQPGQPPEDHGPIYQSDV